MPLSDSQHRMLFPSAGWQITSQLLYLLAVSLLSHYISRRIRLEDISSYYGLTQISWPRMLIVLTFIDSWAFLFCSGVVVGGAGMELNSVVCSMGILSCIIFYATSKLFIYLFLTEKVYVVWSNAPSTPRFRSPIFLTCFVVVMLYLVVGINMIFERISYFRDDGACVIGLKRAGSLTLLSYDLAINLLLTGLFLTPLVRARIRNLHIRRVGYRSIVAAVVALTSSCINVLVLTLLHGEELAWVCLASCGLDVVINSTALFWVTSGTSLRPHQSQVREVMAAGSDGPFKQNGAFICDPPKESQRNSFPPRSQRSQLSHRSIQLQELSIPSPSLPQTVSFSDASGPKLDSLQISLSPIPDEHQPSADIKRSEEEVLPLDDVELGLGSPTQPPQSLVTIPDRARTPGRTIRPFLGLAPLFRRRRADRSTDLQITITRQTEVGRDHTSFPSPTPCKESFDMFEDAPRVSSSSGDSISRANSPQWNPGGPLDGAS